MEKNEVVRVYKFADGTLIVICNEKHSFAQRDQTEMITMGIDAPYLLDYVSDINAFEVLPTDEEFMGDLVIATEKKDTDADKVREDVRGIMTRVQNKFGAESGRYRKYGTKGLSRLNDDTLLVCARRVVRVATADLAELASEGLTAPIIAALNTDCQTFEDSMNAQKDAVAARDIAAEDRVEAGNALFAKVTRICNAGQNIWHETNEAKFNDYIIYNTPTGGPVPIDRTLNPDETKVVIERQFAEQDVVKCKNTGAGDISICITVNGTTACSAGTVVPSGGTITVFASDLGDVVANKFLNVTNLDHVQPGSCTVTISEA